MKKIILLVLAAVITCSTNAQFKLTKLYAQPGTDALGIKTVFKNKWAITASTTSFKADPKLPADYISTSYAGANVLDALLYFISFGAYYTPNIQYTQHLKPTNVRFSNISFGRFYPLTRSISVTAEAGLGLTTAEQYIFSKTSFDNKIRNAYYGYSDNYNITTINVVNGGGIVRAGFDWAFSSFAGLGLEGFYNINGGGIKNHGGVNVKLLLGWMNRPPRK